MSLNAADRWVTVRRLFEAAVDLPCDQRLAFLDSACADEGTRCEVLGLLAADESAVDLPVDRDPAVANEGVAERFPEVLGFRIDRRLGAGSLIRKG